MKIVSRRGFMKFVGGLIGDVPLPGIARTLLVPFAPEAEKIEDLEEIFQGLVKRFKTIILTEDDGKIIASFLRRFKTKTGDEMDRLWKKRDEICQKHGEKSPEFVLFQQKETDQVCRFWDEISRIENYSSIQYKNIITTKRSLLPEVLRAVAPLIEKRIKIRKEIRSTINVTGVKGFDGG